jgi:hypothetical protein
LAAERTTMSIKYLTIVFFAINFVAALPLWQIIYKHIAKKPLLSVTLVDLIYKDIIFHTLSLCFFASTGITHTLMYNDESFSLPYEFAIFYSVCINFASNSICISLIFSATLHLISLIKNSEATGDKNN